MSKFDTTQKLERQRVDGKEQRLHRSVGQLRLAKPAQQQIHTRASHAQNFSFATVSTRGSVNSIADLSEVRYHEKRYRSLQSRNPRSTLLTRQTGVWSKLLSLRMRELATSRLPSRNQRSHGDDIEEGTVRV